MQVLHRAFQLGEKMKFCRIQIIIAVFLCFCCNALSFADSSKTLNIYVWYGEIPQAVIQKFEKETGIHVNYADYGSNAVLFAKLEADPNSGYDIVEPSSDYVMRMSEAGLLQPLDKSKVPNFKNIDKAFLNPSYDPHDTYSIPWMWGVTGIFVNKQYFNPADITTWKDLWNKRYYNQIMLLDAPRDVFAVGALAANLSPNSNDPKTIKAIYQNLLNLMPNVKLFNSDAIPSIFIDNDATIGMAWNGDVYRAEQENPNLQFIYPKDGFSIWADCLAIPKNAPHLANAYKFLNFLLQPENASQVTLRYGYATANVKAKEYLPKAMQNNPTIFPSDAVLARGVFENNLSDSALQVYAKYWELLKLNA